MILSKRCDIVNFSINKQQCVDNYFFIGYNTLNQKNTCDDREEYGKNRRTERKRTLKVFTQGMPERRAGASFTDAAARYAVMREFTVN